MEEEQPVFRLGSRVYQLVNLHRQGERSLGWSWVVVRAMEAGAISSRDEIDWFKRHASSLPDDLKNPLLVVPSSTVLEHVVYMLTKPTGAAGWQIMEFPPGIPFYRCSPVIRRVK